MSYRDRRRREGRRLLLARLLKLVIFLGITGTTAFYSYRVGIELARAEVRSLETEVENTTRLNREQAARIVDLDQQLSESRREAEHFKQLYAAATPSPAATELLEMIEAKLKSGLAPGRLSLYIAAAGEPRNCGDLATKRFLVRTPMFDGEATWVRFSDVITVTALGQPARAANGEPEQWFDPEQPIAVTFTAVGGRETKAEGKLPIQHSMVFRNQEYRFTVAPGARGFVEVTGDRCDFGAG